MQSRLGALVEPLEGGSHRPCSDCPSKQALSREAVRVLVKYLPRAYRWAGGQHASRSFLCRMRSKLLPGPALPAARGAGQQWHQSIAATFLTCLWSGLRFPCSNGPNDFEARERVHSAATMAGGREPHVRGAWAAAVGPGLRGWMQTLEISACNQVNPVLQRRGSGASTEQRCGPHMQAWRLRMRSLVFATPWRTSWARR